MSHGYIVHMEVYTCMEFCCKGKLNSKPQANNFSFTFSFLDLSFNHIQVVERLEGVPSLLKFFLIQNKITKIENIGHFTQLTMLELGANRIRVSPIRELYLFVNLYVC